MNEFQGRASMHYLSVCSGIEAATVAWHPLGWTPVGFSEIEKFPSAVLEHHYPEVPNFGDMTTLTRRVLAGEVEAPDVLTGGTPCQAFSVAGKRESLADERGNLSLTFCEIANAIDHVRAARGESPCIVIWENVPGVLSTRDNAFGCFLGALAGSGCELQPPGGRWADAGCVYGPTRAVAWRVLDAQYFGLAQRRRRVFVVASARDGFDPAAVLFEREGVRRDSPPSREAGEVAPTIPSRSTGGGGLGTDFDCDGGLIRDWPAEVACTLNAKFGEKQGLEDQHALGGAQLFVPQVLGTLTARMMNALGSRDVEEGAVLPVAVDTYNASVNDVAPTMCTQGDHASGNGAVLAFGGQMSVPQVDFDLSQTLQAKNPQAVGVGWRVRRITPVEAERLQGFPDNYTAIPWRGKGADQCPDGPRYKALGNSWAVPCARWIGRRIDALVKRLEAA